jgi:(p)ppGpp synthase/HD superfamily hydrolase
VKVFPGGVLRCVRERVVLESQFFLTNALPLTRAALEFALERHAGQLRSDGYAPFVQHPLEVASLLSLAGYQDEVVASGVLHDVLENTEADGVELEDRFGETVAALVHGMSEDDSISQTA